MKFSLRTLLIVTASVAVVCACLAYPSPEVGDLCYSLGLMSIAFAAVLAIYQRGPKRAYWVGFLLLFATYFCHTVWPSELRGTWAVMQRFGGIDYPTQGVFPTRALTLLYQRLHGDFRPTSGLVFGGRTPRGNEIMGKFVAFQTAGHTAIAALLGFCGAVLAQRYALLAETDKPNVGDDGPS
jgi:hypothetical protein